LHDSDQYTCLKRSANCRGAAEERFVYGAPLLAERGRTTRLLWDPNLPVFTREELGAAAWPELDFEARLADPQTP